MLIRVNRPVSTVLISGAGHGALLHYINSLKIETNTGLHYYPYKYRESGECETEFVEGMRKKIGKKISIPRDWRG